MAIIKSGTSPSVMTVGVSSNAHNVTDYYTNGNPIPLSNYIGSYVMPIKVRYSSGFTASTGIIILKNAFSNGYIAIRHINLNSSYDGTTAATEFQIIAKRIKGLQVEVGQAANIIVKPIKMANRFTGTRISECAVSSGTASLALCISTQDNDGGVMSVASSSPSVGSELSTTVSVLSVASNAAELPTIYALTNARNSGCTGSVSLPFDRTNPLILKYDESLFFYSLTTGVAGDNISGFISWDEYSS